MIGQDCKKLNVGKPIFFVLFGLIVVGVFATQIRQWRQGVREGKHQLYEAPDGAFAVEVPAGTRVKMETRSVTAQSGAVLSAAIHATEPFRFRGQRESLSFAVLVINASAEDLCGQITGEQLTDDILGRIARSLGLSIQLQYKSTHDRLGRLVVRGDARTYTRREGELAQAIIEIHTLDDHVIALIVGGIPEVVQGSPAIERFFTSFRAR